MSSLRPDGPGPGHRQPTPRSPPREAFTRNEIERTVIGHACAEFTSCLRELAGECTRPPVPSAEAIVTPARRRGAVHVQPPTSINFPETARCSPASPRRNCKAVARLLTPVTVAQGTVLTREGDLGREAMLHRLGHRQRRTRRQQGGDIGPGELFGELALLTGARAWRWSPPRPTWSSPR